MDVQETHNTKYVNLTDNCLLVDFSCGVWSGKGVDKEFSDKLAKEALANPDAIKSTKNLVAGVEEYADIRRAEWAARAVHRFHTAPWGPSSRILKASAFPVYIDAMKTKSETFYRAVDVFIGVYPDVVERMRQSQTIGGRLGKLFKEEDYPPVEQMRRKFTFDVQVAALTNGEDFRLAVSDDVVEKITETAISTLQTNVVGVTVDLFSRIYEVVSNLAAIFENENQSFKNATIENVEKLVDVMPGLNITGDAELAAICDKLKTEVLVFSPNRLRDDSRVRRTAAEAVRKMEERMRAYAC